MDSFHACFFWLGVVTFVLAALYGLLEGGLILAQRLMKTLGVWQLYLVVLKRMHQERIEARNRSA